MADEDVIRALSEVAEQQGITIEEVMRDIEEIIDVTLASIYANKNQKAIALWREIPCKGERPTAIELIRYLEEKIRLRAYQMDSQDAKNGILQ